MNNIIAIYLLALSIEYIASIYYNVIVKGETPRQIKAPVYQTGAGGRRKHDSSQANRWRMVRRWEALRELPRRSSERVA